MMNVNRDLVKEIEYNFEKIINELYPKLGKGEENKGIIDEIATKLYIDLFYKINKNIMPIEILGIEGKRDGVNIPHIHIPDFRTPYKLMIDPIEGTLTGAKGGSRCLSVIGLYYGNKDIKKLPDDIDIFAVGSNISSDLGKIFFNTADISEKWIQEVKEKGYTIASLNRSETEELLKNFFKVSYKEDDFIGEDTMYFPNRRVENFFLVGDTTIFCPFETEYYWGRTGSVEGRIESSLWKYWQGVLISSKKMKNYVKGQSSYIQDRIKWANSQSQFCIEDFFEEEQIIQLKEIGWNEEEIKHLLYKQDFHPRLLYLWICSLTGTKDRKFEIHSKINLEPIQYFNKKKFFEILKLEDNIEKRTILRRSSS